eukprot:jgi/Mesvir1/23335/Mv21031-RA.1
MGVSDIFEFDHKDGDTNYLKARADADPMISRDKFVRAFDDGEQKGYFHSQSVCDVIANGKAEAKQWRRYNDAARLIADIEKENDNVRAIVTFDEYGPRRGSWLHPLLFDAFFQWASKGNTCIRYEDMVQANLADSLGGEREVECRGGFIDILVRESKLLIEVKEIGSWSGIEQLLIYGKDYPDFKKRLHLFKSPSTRSVNTRRLALLREACRELGIEVTFDETMREYEDEGYESDSAILVPDNLPLLIKELEYAEVKAKVELRILGIKHEREIAEAEHAICVEELAIKRRRLNE